jgi:hypothetical protein
MTWQAFPADLTPLASVDANLATYLVLTITGDQLKAALDSDTRTSLAKLTDGTSKTALLFEAAGKNDLWRAGNRTGQQLSGFLPARAAGTIRPAADRSCGEAHRTGRLVRARAASTVRMITVSMPSTRQVPTW